MDPGDTAGACPTCDEPMTMIGYDHKVFGTVCESCSVIIGTTDTATVV